PPTIRRSVTPDAASQPTPDEPDDHGRLQIGDAATNRRIVPRGVTLPQFAPDLGRAAGMLVSKAHSVCGARAPPIRAHPPPSLCEVRAGKVQAAGGRRSPSFFLASCRFPSQCPWIGRSFPTGSKSEREAMKALILYVAFVAIGATISATIGYYVE